MSVVQEVQSALSGMDVLSDEPDGYARGSTQSLVVPTNATSGPKRAETFSGFDYKLKPDNIYRASSMRVPERPGMSAGFPSRQLPDTSATTGESPKLRHKRKTSGGSWPFLPKGSSKDDKEQSGERGTGKIRPVTERHVLKANTFRCLVEAISETQCDAFMLTTYRNLHSISA